MSVRSNRSILVDARSLGSLRHDADLIRIDLELGAEHVSEADTKRYLVLRDRIALAVEHLLSIAIDLKFGLADNLLGADELGHMPLQLSGKDQDTLAWLELRCFHLIGILRLGERTEGSHFIIWNGLWAMLDLIAHEADNILLYLAIEERLTVFEGAMHKDDAWDDDLLFPHHAVGELDLYALHWDEAFHLHLLRIDLDEEVFLLGLAAACAFLLILDTHEVLVYLKLMLRMHVACIPVDLLLERLHLLLRLDELDGALVALGKLAECFL